MVLRAALPALLLAVLLSGCGGKSGPAGFPAEAPKDGALVHVLVINDEYLPIRGAEVSIAGLGVRAATGDDGAAHLVLDHAGRYRLEVHHPRFLANATTLLLAPGDETTARVALRDAPHDENFRDTILYNGICLLPTWTDGGGLGDGDCRDAPGVPPGHFTWFLAPGFRQGEFEVRFDPQPGGLDRMRLAVSLPEAGEFADGTRGKEVSGRSPLLLTIAEDLITQKMREPGTKIEIRLTAAHDAPASAGGAQPFLLIGELDYFVPAPAHE